MAMNPQVDVMRETERRIYRSDLNGDESSGVPEPGGVGPDGLDFANDEALRLIHQALLQGSPHPRVITFAGMNHGNGCSRVCASVAALLARDADRSICLVEANLRSPAVSGLFGEAGGPGLTDALKGKKPIRSFCVPADLRGNLWLLSCGTLFPDAAALLTSGSLRGRVAELRTEFDFVIIDAPPLARYADSIALGQLADGLVLIVEDGSTRRDETAAAVANLRASGVTILAAVLNKATSPVPERVYKVL